ncbi:MAG: hypothetical protein ABJO09_10015 [Hyphomicrobiales bacterium]
MATSTNTPTEPTEILPQEDYNAIEGAVMETARGRWFLAEYARRHRAADTEMLMGAIAKLERSLANQTILPASKTDTDLLTDESTAPEPNDKALEKVLLDVAELSAAIQLTRQEIEELGSKQAQDGGFEQASNELDAIVSHTEQATGEILTAAEAIQEAAWQLRDQGTDPEVCDKLDTHAIEIYTACTFQDITGQRIAKVVSLMGFVEGHVQSMMGIWHEGEAAARAAKASPDDTENADETISEDASDTFDEADLLNGPALEGSGLDQGNIDDLLDGGFDSIEVEDTAEEDEATADADVFAEAEVEPEESSAQSATVEETDGSDSEDADADDEQDPFAGQDAFESTEETVQRANEK